MILHPHPFRYMTPQNAPERTPLYDTHVALNARMMPFGGFEMPVQYSGIIDEHLTVRRNVGLFDVSHMGEVLVRGPEALNFIQNLITNDASRMYDGRAMYTVMCKPDGGIVDDLLVYRFSEQEYMLVINAANIDKDLKWMRANNEVGADLENISERTALLAVQGPESFNVVQKLVDIRLDDLKYYHFLRINSKSFSHLGDVILSHTGYTGEKGIEIYCDSDRALAIWEALMTSGKEHGIKPAGLGARDTLRIEAGFALYGNDITEETNPLEAGLGWLVKLDKNSFIGKPAIERIKIEGTARRLIGFMLEERGIPRQGFPIQNQNDIQIGYVTSGTQSPILEKGIGLGYVENKADYTTPDSLIKVSIRNRSIPARVVKPPFHKK